MTSWRSRGGRPHRTDLCVGCVCGQEPPLTDNGQEPGAEAGGVLAYSKSATCRPREIVFFRRSRAAGEGFLMLWGQRIHPQAQGFAHQRVEGAVAEAVDSDSKPTNPEGAIAEARDSVGQRRGAMAEGGGSGGYWRLTNADGIYFCKSMFLQPLRPKNRQTVAKTLEFSTQT